jgi:hypothetical protein
MAESLLPPRLSEQQLALLRAIYMGLKQQGKWPTFYVVDKALDAQGLDIDEVAATLPRGLTNVSVRPLNPQDEATLTAAGLSYVPEAVDDADMFMRILWFSIEAEHAFQPPSDGSNTEGPLVTSEELQRSLGARMEQLNRLRNLIQWEPWSGSSSWTDEHYEFHVTRQARRFRGVQTIREYAERRLAALEQAFGQVPRAGAPRPVVIAPAPVPSPGSADSAPASASSPKAVFVIMPFDERLSPVYVQIREVCTSLGIECRRSDEIDEAGRITEQIYEAIENADALVADISDRNPNVMYELGYAHALKKAVIILNSGSDAPFDVADFRWIGYRIDDLSHSKEKLANSLRSTLRLGERS